MIAATRRLEKAGLAKVGSGPMSAIIKNGLTALKRFRRFLSGYPELFDQVRYAALDAGLAVSEQLQDGQQHSLEIRYRH